MTPVARNILIACVAVFLLQQVTLLPEYYLALWSPEAGAGFPPFRPWQLVTHALLHSDWVHLFVNMFGLFMFGPQVEQVTGSRRFLVYFLVCVLTGGLTHIAMMAVLGDPVWEALGASGGLFGVLLAFGVLFPKRKVMLLFPPIPMPAWLLVVLYAFFELYSGFLNRGSGIGHFAHLGGMIGGLVLILYWKRQLRGIARR